MFINVSDRFTEYNRSFVECVNDIRKRESLMKRGTRSSGLIREQNVKSAAENRSPTKQSFLFLAYTMKSKASNHKTSNKRTNQTRTNIIRVIGP
ncbi:unnamed protein product [Rotaria socialis]